MFHQDTWLISVVRSPSHRHKHEYDLQIVHCGSLSGFFFPEEKEIYLVHNKCNLKGGFSKPWFIVI